MQFGGGGGFRPRPAKNDLECFKIVTNFVTESYYKKGVRLTFFDVLSRITLDFIKQFLLRHRCPILGSYVALCVLC